MTKMAKRIYVADDEAYIREIIQSFLVNEGFDVQVFANGDDLLEVFSQTPSDMVILDIMMPGLDGLALCSRIRQRSRIPIFIVSARDSELDRITGITLGSDDYLTKPFSPIELVARVKAIFRRMDLDCGVYSANQLTVGNLMIDIRARSVTCQGKAFDVTPTEFALLTYLFSNPDRAISREELLRNVWQFDFDADTRATDDLIKRLRKKLTSIDCHIRIDSIWGFGFRLVTASAAGGMDENH